MLVCFRATLFGHLASNLAESTMSTAFATVYRPVEPCQILDPFVGDLGVVVVDSFFFAVGRRLVAQDQRDQREAEI